MLERTNRILLLVTAFALLGNMLHLIEPFSTAAQTSTPEIVQKDNPELEKLYAEDQSDRQPPKEIPIDWETVSLRDEARLKRVKALFSQSLLLTGKDFYRAAMILQHGIVPEDYLLAHELCIVAISKGEKLAKWLAAASEDRYLMNIGRPQRFGTQYRSDGAGQPMRLYQVDPNMTDELRKEMEVPTLAKAKEREAKMNQKK